MARMFPAEASRLLKNVPEQFTFYCLDGSRFWNLEDLARAVGSMSEEVFAHHVNEEKNDFANWVFDIVGDHTLAHQLRSTRSLATTSRRLNERVALLLARRG
jgi:hypothetical protein